MFSQDEADSQGHKPWYTPADDVRIHLTLSNKMQLMGVITKVMGNYSDKCDLLVHSIVSLAILMKKGEIWL